MIWLSITGIYCLLSIKQLDLELRSGSCRLYTNSKLKFISFLISTKILYSSSNS